MEPRPPIDTEHLGTGPCHRLYETSAGWVFLTITTDAEWQRFTVAAGCARDSRDDEGRLESLFRTRPAAEWERILGDAGVSCAVADAATPGQFFAHHEQMRVNGLVPTVQHARFGAVRRWGPLVTVNGRADSYGPGVLAGEHTDRLLAELGFHADEIQRLRTAGLVTSET